MRYRLIALAVTLVGFLAINYVGNEQGQALILRPSDPVVETGEPGLAGSLRAATEAQAQIRDALIETRTMLDSLESMGIRTDRAEDLRQKNRVGLERFEQLRMSGLISRILWRQTLVNMIWAVVCTTMLVPLALYLDRRQIGQEGSTDGDPVLPGPELTDM
jgi:hypothetical protein